LMTKVFKCGKGKNQRTSQKALCAIGISKFSRS
jgi:hypothetical protein